MMAVLHKRIHRLPHTRTPPGAAREEGAVSSAMVADTVALVMVAMPVTAQVAVAEAITTSLFGSETNEINENAASTAARGSRVAAAAVVGVVVATSARLSTRLSPLRPT